MPETISLRGNGKLLLTAEYLVLKGALALAIPLRFGQSLSASETNSGYISWHSNDSNGLWFSCKLNPASFEILETNNDAIATKLIRYLKAARHLNADFLRSNGLSVSVSANYPLEWGLGSSSSLISIIARWAGVDAWRLFRMCFTGSGYDLACADSDLPIFYRLKEGMPVISTVEPASALKNYTYFAFLGSKQDSATEVAAFMENKVVHTGILEKVSALSIDICLETDFRDLCVKVDEHERIMSEILERPTLKSARFAAFPGSVKSLGAWGGDFGMFLSDLPAKEVQSQLKNFGIADTIFTFNELIR